MGKDDVVVINQGLEQRTSKSSGKVRYVITMKTDPVIFSLDPKRLGATVTQAIIHHLKERVKGISAQVSARTLKDRAVTAKAYAAGKPWAIKRYSGGKTGETPPSAGNTTAFNNSERFANSITGSASSDGSWRINVAANRINAALSNPMRVWARLVELVPEFGDPSLLLQSDIIRKGVDKATRDVVNVVKGEGFERAIELVRETIGLLGEVGDVLAG